MNPSQIAQDCKKYFDQLTNDLPLFIKLILCSTCILYLINLFIPYISFFLANIPYYTIYYFQIWRLITTICITTGIMSIIFSCLFWFKEAVKLEKKLGTIKYMLIFFLNNLCIQIMYSIVTFFLSILIRNNFLLRMKITQSGVNNTGLIPVILCDITLLCLSNPDGKMSFFFLPWLIPSKYYPLVLFLIFTILSGFYIDLESLCAIGFAYLNHKYLKHKLTISNNLVTKVENIFLFSWMKNQKGYISLGGSIVGELKNNLEGIRNVDIGEKNNQQTIFTAFKGNGVPVGSSSDINNEQDKNNIEYTNITVGSSGSNEETLNSGDTRADLNAPRPGI